MLRITKQADYAIILLGQFVTGSKDGAYTARDLSVETQIPLPMVGKILKSLVRRHLLVSHRGVKGGYQLARPAPAITVAEIIEATDGPIGITACSVHAGNCEHEGRCPARSNWARINRAILDSLRGITLADMARPLVEHRVTPAELRLTAHSCEDDCQCRSTARLTAARPLTEEIA